MKITKFYKAKMSFCGKNTTKELQLVAGTYSAGGGLAVISYLKNGEEWGCITVNLKDAPPANRAYIDTNNNPWACDFLEKNGIAKPTGITGFSGFCAYPLYEFDMTLFNEVKPV